MRILLLLLAFLSGINVRAQDPVLFENTWYLYLVVVDGQEFDFPYDGQTGALIFTDANISVIHPACEDALVTDVTYDGDFTFTTQDGNVALLGTCDQPTALHFQKHYSFYLEDDNNTAKNPFAYTWVSMNGETYLGITNADGDSAFYSNVELGTGSFSYNDFTVYPNPASEAITVVSSLTIDRVSMTDIFGKVVLTDQSTRLDVSMLESGIYLVRIESEGRSVVKRIVVN